MRYLCFLPWLWVGCTPSSILTLTVNVSGDALAQVEDFPVQVQVDFANDERILSLEICEFAGGDFLEATLDPETYQVRADGELLTCEPSKELAMAQRYFLF